MSVYVFTNKVQVNRYVVLAKNDYQSKYNYPIEIFDKIALGVRDRAWLDIEELDSCLRELICSGLQIDDVDKDFAPFHNAFSQGNFFPMVFLDDEVLTFKICWNSGIILESFISKGASIGNVETENGAFLVHVGEIAINNQKEYDTLVQNFENEVVNSSYFHNLKKYNPKDPEHSSAVFNICSALRDLCETVLESYEFENEHPILWSPKLAQEVVKDFQIDKESSDDYLKAVAAQIISTWHESANSASQHPKAMYEEIKDLRSGYRGLF